MSHVSLPLPNIANYGLLKGIVKFKPSGGSSYLDLGNALEFEVQPKIEFLPHWNFRLGSKFKDQIAIRSKEFGLRMILDELATQNLEYFVLGKANTQTTVLSTTAAVTSGSPNATLTAQTGLVNGSTYKIFDSGNTDIPAGTTFTYTGSAAIVMSQNATATNATDAVTILPGYDSVDIGSAPINFGAVRLVGTNDVGVRVQVDAPTVNFAPSGNLALVGDDWGRMEMMGDILGNPSTGSFGTLLVGIDSEVTS